MERLTCRKKCELKAHSIVLKGAHEEDAVEEDRPDCHVCQDPSGQTLGANHRSSVRQNSDEVPSKWTGDDR